jgi:hypothetical protein
MLAYYTLVLDGVKIGVYASCCYNMDECLDGVKISIFGFIWIQVIQHCYLGISVSYLSFTSEFFPSNSM